MYLLFYQKFPFEWLVLLACAESPKCSSRTWSVNVLMTALALFGSLYPGNKRKTRGFKCS